MARLAVDALTSEGSEEALGTACYFPASSSRPKCGPSKVRREHRRGACAPSHVTSTQTPDTSPPSPPHTCTGVDQLHASLGRNLERDASFGARTLGQISKVQIAGAGKMYDVVVVSQRPIAIANLVVQGAHVSAHPRSQVLDAKVGYDKHVPCLRLFILLPLRPLHPKRVIFIVNCSSLRFRETGGDYLRSWHNPPHRQLTIVLEGELEIQVGDGSTR